NQYGKEFPTGGMNEKGLVVELMWLDETVYPKEDKRPAIGVLQWIQYQLDNCSTIEEVIATDKLLRITTTVSPLHYLIADASGHAATIEFLNGGMVVHKGNDLPFPVLTNSMYDESAQYARQAAQNNSFINGNGSLERFARACQMINQYTGQSSASLIDHSFNILEAVSQGSHTKWSIVYDITNRRVYFRTHDAPQIRSVSFSAFDLSCGIASLYFNMNTKVEGDVSKSFKPLTFDINKQMLEETAELSKNEVRVSPAMQEAAVRYASLISCK
ncbi:MAG TPA: linear amide C-N hydrolase, partial [Chitinophagaceae bacterium]|nr:linear amide C-N hydrolase [Chitinophagaceae bacterium]